MPQAVRVLFHKSSPPYEPGDAAGFPAPIARRYVDRGVASFVDPRPAAADLAAMSRDALVRYAVELLGFDGEPPAELSDDELRQALLAALASPADVPSEPPALDQLDALDRAHLEAFATTKLGFETIDPALSDDDLRAQIRAKASAGVAAASLSSVASADAAPAPASSKAGKAK